MDSRGRAFDNIFVERLWRRVKHEDVYFKGYASMCELTAGLADYFAFYNEERPHQALANSTPAIVYRTATGGGAMIVNKYRRATEESLSRLAEQGIPPSRKSDQRRQVRQHPGNVVQK